ncbi:L-dehydroascorbate transporter large permease subunit [Cronobacter sakazakii]|nr:L-dehydroascorbate transporter large permease subunit [Cronobacter sakazakii]
MTVVIILGGILTGVFTATESAAVACLWAFFVTMFIYRDYQWSELPKLMFRTVKTVTIVMILIGVCGGVRRGNDLYATADENYGILHDAVG